MIIHLDGYAKPNDYGHLEYSMTAKEFRKVILEIASLDDNGQGLIAIILSNGVHFLGVALLSGILMELGRVHMERFAEENRPEWLQRHAFGCYILGWLFIPFYTSLHALVLSCLLHPDSITDNKTRGMAACSIIALIFIGLNVLSVFFFRGYILMKKVDQNKEVDEKNAAIGAMA